MIVIMVKDVKDKLLLKNRIIYIHDAHDARTHDIFYVSYMIKTMLNP